MTIDELNGYIDSGDINEVIRVAEARQCKMLSQIADQICVREDTRMVLVAGGSAAGKTTTAKRLCTQFRVNHCDVLHLSTDDYFVGDARNPRDENGKLDYEHVDCVDIDLLTADLNGLLKGETVPLRRFDFVRHEPATPTRNITLPEDGLIVLEGIHALNPKLTPQIDDACKFRIFVEPQPSLVGHQGARMNPSAARFLRRMVRDLQFRKMTPVQTIEMWPNVLRGEEMWINPFRAKAERLFDSYLSYELAVLKPYVEDLLKKALKEVGSIPEVESLIRLFEVIKTASSDAVPGDSIIRETIGGSQLEY